MFTEKIDVDVFSPQHINHRVLSDINELLKLQHSRAGTVNEETLQEHMQKSKVVVAWQDERVIAMGVLVRVYCVSHTFGSIHNFVIRDGYDVCSIAPRILELLIKDVFDLAFIDAHVAKKNQAIIAVLEAFRFKEKPKSKYRLRLQP